MRLDGVDTSCFEVIWIVHFTFGNPNLNPDFQRRLKKLAIAGFGDLRDGRKGIEKESLRIAFNGRIAQTPHPPAFGSALTHAYITTDYSEALPELRTSPYTDVKDTLDFLRELHQFVYSGLERELLWATSMPCRLEGEHSVPIAQYGSSNVGTMKHVYRRGLAYRYGRIMQAIAGVHFNYSLPDGFWPAFQEGEGDSRALQDFISESYFSLLRNFQRLSWLVCYLFGASPAVDRSFAANSPAGLVPFDDATLYAPFATSLRMSDIGYQSKIQNGLNISYAGLVDYIDGLTRATQTSNAEYERIGTVVNGEYRQLNTHILQIDNEYYSFARPKQVTRSGERPTLALKRRGVQYVELRAIDVDPFEPLGVNESELRFLETLLILCLLQSSSQIGAEEHHEIEFNQLSITRNGRDPKMSLRRGGRALSVRSWSAELIEPLQAVCDTLDAGDADRPYHAALKVQIEAMKDPDRTPAARMLAEMRRERESFFEFALRMSRTHEQRIKQIELSEERKRYFSDAARQSLAQQREIEASDAISFEEYLKQYFA